MTSKVKIFHTSDDIRDFKQIATAADSTAVVVGEVWGEYVTVARQNSTLSNAQPEIVRLG